MEDKDLSLSEKLDKLLEGMEGMSEKKKKFRMPLNVFMKSGKIRKGDYIIVQFIKNSGAVVFKVMKIEDETVKVGDKYYDSSAESILRYKKKPLLIIKEWDMQPFSPREELIKAVEAGTLTSAQKFILLKLKSDAVKSKMQLNLGMILLLLGLGAGILLLLNYLKVI